MSTTVPSYDAKIKELNTAQDKVRKAIADAQAESRAAALRAQEAAAQAQKATADLQKLQSEQEDLQSQQRWDNFYGYFGTGYEYQNVVAGYGKSTCAKSLAGLLVTLTILSTITILFIGILSMVLYFYYKDNKEEMGKLFLYFAIIGVTLPILDILLILLLGKNNPVPFMLFVNGLNLLFMFFALYMLGSRMITLQRKGVRDHSLELISIAFGMSIFNTLYSIIVIILLIREKPETEMKSS